MAVRRIDFLGNATDMKVAVLASLGFSTAFIMTRTGMTVGQVLYRLKLAGVRRTDYRNGGGMADYVIKGATEKAEFAVVGQVKKAKKEKAAAK